MGQVDTLLHFGRLYRPEDAAGIESSTTQSNGQLHLGVYHITPYSDPDHSEEFFRRSWLQKLVTESLRAMGWVLDELKTHPILCKLSALKKIQNELNTTFNILKQYQRTAQMILSDMGIEQTSTIRDVMFNIWSKSTISWKSIRKPTSDVKLQLSLNLWMAGLLVTRNQGELLGFFGRLSLWYLNRHEGGTFSSLAHWVLSRKISKITLNSIHIDALTEQEQEHLNEYRSPASSLKKGFSIESKTLEKNETSEQDRNQDGKKNQNKREPEERSRTPQLK